ncbi:hypothetical protein C3747_108g88 [Trypanosoma cruzi]|uniref:Uncharacterized protein n=2 Tax=Trypanosoma cruzi TaxID=5693 RepID=Q4D120_TRYCC|nr:hypothetical protein, conserved [Trypanosoma cruzi]EAN86225.1 hypothetical protein, conserved [Trypanosoma cruzi]PWV06945.1 hypothetical protein C3747_108g88 [Trypanosoma cruzi]RNC40251.1 hypothetical protein TcCL_NonESM10281 [Trypanosoma cruzi]|eukprot:XP_808076.1 hypothetical protein [Trypanosoma cruzi strain CL Brener]
MFEVPVECCECAVPIGDEGPLRAVLLLPCQHLLHAGCVEYVRKRRKLQQLIARGDAGGVGAALPTPFELGSESIDKKNSNGGCSRDSRLVACPACMVPIQRLIPLFPSGGDTRCGSKFGGGEAASCFKKTHHAQKTHIAQLRTLYEQRERVTQLTRTCALMHARLSETQAELDRLSKTLPIGAPAAHVPQLAGERLCVENMTATELEMYIMHSSATLEELEHDVSEQRRLAEKKRKKLGQLQSRYQALREMERRPRNTHKREKDADSSSSESLCRSSSRGKRPRAPPVVDVEEEATSKAQAMIVSSDNGSSDEEGESRKGDKNNPDNNVDDQEDDDVLYIDQTTPQFSSSGGSRSPAAPDASSHAWQPHMSAGVRRDRRSLDENNDTSNGGNADAVIDDADDAMMCYNPMRRVLTKQQSGIHAPNATRLLPRREDRLWQPSLEGIL